MKKSSLALISSPAIFAAILLASAPAHANPSSSLNKDSDSYSSSIVITRTAQSLDSKDISSDDRANILTSDRIGDMAVQKFGCDCMGCRQAVLSLVSK
ncbi:hypothetical protein [Pseudanabaena sp. UWO310]|uniref:hypothetical protein n=1 Tax=Pseudanabaena sp. UWO310 TaxID=2480795 RepID=UPI00115A4B25|nr:hypothetical protein [Pseudanabaena sp. UWO310]TYQ26900.1 hypothetical protein PseudUWO310_16740 [Pseudanabaena sp. UWO310]